MSASAPLRALAFGAVDGSLWAAAVDPPSGGRGRGRPMLVLRIGTDQSPVEIADGLSWSVGDGGAWALSGDGVALSVTPIAPVTGEAEQSPATGPAEGQGMCRVQGTVTVATDSRAIDCVGVRAEAGGRAPDSVRLISAWFSDTDALELVSARPEPGAHHDGDAIRATLFDHEGWIPVGDPRLSTTYDGESGRPTRCTLELWIGEGENEFPRRAAGEVSGPGAAAGADGVSLQVSPLSTHSRGQDGSGVYVLATF